MTIYIPGGYFISFEGGEGTGKTTQLEILTKKLQSDGFEVVQTREPGGTELGEKIRVILMDLSKKLPNMTRLLLFAVARRENVETVIKPGLAAGKIVIADRYIDSTIAYQYGGSRLPIERIKKLNRSATQGILPDLTFVLDINPWKGLEKSLKVRRDAFNMREIDFHQRVNSMYLDIARQDTKRCAIMPYKEGDIEGMADEIYRVAKTRIWEKV